MKKINGYYCKICRRSGYDPADCLHPQPGALSDQEIIYRLLKTVSDLEKENEQLANTVNWMHDTIWEQLRLIQAYRQDSKIPVGKS